MTGGGDDVAVGGDDVAVGGGDDDVAVGGNVGGLGTGGGPPFSNVFWGVVFGELFLKASLTSCCKEGREMGR